MSVRGVSDEGLISYAYSEYTDEMRRRLFHQDYFNWPDKEQMDFRLKAHLVVAVDMLADKFKEVTEDDRKAAEAVQTYGDARKVIDTVWPKLPEKKRT